MDSFFKAPRFLYNPSANPERDSGFSAVLEIHVHHARNIHNICIYENQDVYAKFSLTSNPDETFPTKVSNGGGKNPEFNEDLIMKVNQKDAVLKCEIWMLSRAKSYMDDQLLGFALVPLSSLVGKGKVTEDFSLTSTDLFHSPAGTVKLSLSLSGNDLISAANLLSDSVEDSSITSKDLLDRKTPDETLEYSRLEFPDMNVVNENQQMVSEYFDMAKYRSGTLLRPWLEKADGLFLHLGSAPHQPLEDYEMMANSSDELVADSVSPNGSIQTSGFLSSTMTSLSDDRNSADSMEKKNNMLADVSNSPSGTSINSEANQRLRTSRPETPTSVKGVELKDGKESNLSGNEDISRKETSKNPVNLVSAPLRNISLQAEESAMQRQIVDMYMRSMQQFTESLAKMKLPMDLDKSQANNQADELHNHNKSMEMEKKKENSRVFYGSRAFF